MNSRPGQGVRPRLPRLLRICLSVLGASLVLSGFVVDLYGGPSVGGPLTIVCPPCTWPPAFVVAVPLVLFVSGASILALSLPLSRESSSSDRRTNPVPRFVNFSIPAVDRIAVFAVLTGAGVAFLGTQTTVLYGCASGPCIPPPEVLIPTEIFAVGVALVILGCVIGFRVPGSNRPTRRPDD